VRTSKGRTVSRQRFVVLGIAFLLTAGIAFGLGMLFARNNGPSSEATDSATIGIHQPPRVMLDPSKVKLLPDADLHLRSFDAGTPAPSGE
jgi:hypothetical protein